MRVHDQLPVFVASKPDSEYKYRYVCILYKSFRQISWAVGNSKHIQNEDKAL